MLRAAAPIAVRLVKVAPVHICQKMPRYLLFRKILKEQVRPDRNDHHHNRRENNPLDYPAAPFVALAILLQVTSHDVRLDAACRKLISPGKPYRRRRWLRA